VKDVSPTPSSIEKIETEPLPQRERNVRTGGTPVESSPLIDVESTPMEVAPEESREHNN